jgi:hypothetical protein
MPAPSGSGKTHFVQDQAGKTWVDGDDLWLLTAALPGGSWWLEPLDRRVELEARADIVTQEARRFDFWIVGVSNTWLRPDAVVIPKLRTQLSYLSHRDKQAYDGGFAGDQKEQILAQRKWFAR